MSELRELYQEVILDHNKNPRNFKKLDLHSHHANGHNPLCGDKLELFLDVVEGIITDELSKNLEKSISDFTKGFSV